MSLENVTIFCFGASYTVAFLLSCRARAAGAVAANPWDQLRSGRDSAHTVFIGVRHPSLSTRYGSLLFLAWILAVFCVYGDSPSPLAWGIFVWPLVLTLVVLAACSRPWRIRRACPNSITGRPIDAGKHRLGSVLGFSPWRVAVPGRRGVVSASWPA